MGLMSDPTSGARMILTPHPVTLAGQKHIAAAMHDDEKLGAFLARTVPDWNRDAWEVRINGVVVPVEILDRVRPKSGTLIEVRGVVRKQVLYVVAFALLTWWTMGAFAAAGAGGTVLGLSGMAAYAAAAAVYVGGSMLINKVLGPKPPGAGSAQQADPVYSINSARNAPRQYEPLPILFGSTRITPDIASMPYTWIEGTNQILGMVLTPGINVHSIEELYNGDTLLSAYEGVQVYLNGLPGHTDQPIPLYSNADTLAGGTLEKTGNWVERTTPPNTVRVQINLEYMLGDVTSKGKPHYNRETVVVERRETGGSAWMQIAVRSFANNTYDTKRATISVGVPEGQHDIRVRRLGQAFEDKNGKASFQYLSLTAVQADETDYTGIPRIGIRVKATGQLNGALDEVRMVAHSTPIPVWTGSAWVTQHTSNPGAHLLAYARGIRDINGRLLAGIGLPDAQIDIPALQAFMAHCAANDYTYDAYIKDSRNHQEMVDSLALAGFGQTTWAGGKFSVVWASADQPLSGMVNMATIKKGSFQVDYTLANAADGIEYTYVDNATWQPVTLRVPAPGITTMQNPARITGEGVTSEEHAARLARWHLAQSLYQYKDISYATDLEHLTYRRMSLLALSHDMTQWGFGGRLRGASLAGGTVTVSLDDPVPHIGTPFIGLRVPGEMVYRVFPVLPFTGESDTLTLGEPWPDGVPFPGDSDSNPAHDTIWIYDIKSTPGYRVRVVQIEPESDLQGAGVVVVPESPEFWTYVHTGEYIPPANQSLLQGRPAVTNVVVSEHQVVQGDTTFTELSLVFDVVGKMDFATVDLSAWDGDGWGDPEKVAETRTTAARFRVPGAGAYTITVRPYGDDGVVGIPATVQYVTEGAEIPPPAFDSFDVVPLAGGVRKYTWGYDEDTLQAPDFAGAEIRYVAGTVADPDWDAMTPVGDEGYHPAAFESTVPVAGTWTFAARARNTSGELSAAIVITRTLAENLGEVIDGIETGQNQNTQDIIDLFEQNAQLAQDIADDFAQEAIDRAAEIQAAADALQSEIDTIQSQLTDIIAAPDWDAITTYNAGDLVKHEGFMYRSKTTNTNQEPPNATHWDNLGQYESLGEMVSAHSTAISLLQTDVSELDGIVTAHTSDINALDSRVDVTEVGLSANTSAIGTLQTTTTNHGDALTTQGNAITALDSRVDDVEGVAAGQATALSGLTTRVTNAEGEIDAVASDLTALGTVVAGKASTTALNALTTRVTDAEDGLSAASTSITSLEASTGTLSGNLVSNPTAEFDLSGWAMSGGSGTGNFVFGRNYSDTYTIPPGSFYMRQTDAVSDAYRDVTSNPGNFIAVEPGQRYCIQALASAHRCSGRLFAYFYANANDAASLSNTYGQPAPNNATPGAALHNTVAGAQLLYQFITVPAGANYLRLAMRKFGTSSGSDSFLFFSRFGVNKVTAQQTGVPAWEPSAAGIDGTRGAAIQTLDTRVTSVEGVNSVQGTAITNLTAAMGGKADASALTALDARVTSAEGTITSTATQVTNLRATLGGSGNLLPNSDFGLGHYGWTQGTGGGTVPGVVTAYPHTAAPGPSYIPQERGGFWLRNAGGGPLPAGTYIDTDSTGYTIPAEAGKRYVGSVYLGAHRAIGSIYLRFLNASGGHISYSGQGTTTTATGNNSLLSNMGRVRAQGIAPAGTAYVQMKIRAFGGQGGSGDSYLFITSPMIEEAGANQTEPSPYSVGAAGIGSVTHLAQVTATSANNKINAKVGLYLDVNGNVSGYETTNDGVVSEFKVLADKFQIVSPTAGQRTEFSNGNWRVYDAAGTLRVRLGVW